MKHIPMRMCAACRQMKPKAELIRLTDTDGEISVDKTQKRLTRGVYICADTDCIALAKKKKALQRQFKRKIDDALYEQIAESMNL